MPARLARTVLPASALPCRLMPLARSLALMLFSPATVLRSGWPGAMRSTSTLRLPVLDTLPARSLAVALISEVPLAGISLAL